MRIIAQGSLTLTGASDRVIPNGTGAGQLPAKTTIAALMIRANHAITNTGQVLVGTAVNGSIPNHYLGNTDLKGYLILHSGNSEDFIAVGTVNDILFWTAFN